MKQIFFLINSCLGGFITLQYMQYKLRFSLIKSTHIHAWYLHKGESSGICILSCLGQVGSFQGKRADISNK